MHLFDECKYKCENKWWQGFFEGYGWLSCNMNQWLQLYSMPKGGHFVAKGDHCMTMGDHYTTKGDH